jgi:hypothetical protein
LTIILFLTHHQSHHVPSTLEIAKKIIFYNPIRSQLRHAELELDKDLGARSRSRSWGKRSEPGAGAGAEIRQHATLLNTHNLYFPISE